MNEKYVHQTNLDLVFGQVNNIKKEVYENVKYSYEMLLKYLWFEEKFRVLLNNFYEFEKDVYELYLKCNDCNTKKEIVEVGEEGIILLNRRLLNFTASAKMYTDEIDYDTSEIFENATDEKIQDKITEFKSEKYDESVSYQLLELIRNILQHRSLLIRGITILNFFNDNVDITPIFVNIRYSDIKKNKRFENKIKNKKDLDKYNCDDLNIEHHIRKYMSSLFEVHKYYRELIDEDVKNNLSLISKNIEEIEEKKKQSFEEIAFMQLSEDNQEKDGVLVNKNYINKYSSKISNNKLNFEKYFLSKSTKSVKQLCNISCEKEDIGLNMIY